jgi:tetratricopeptide (TPR) repeat protein
MNNPNPKNPGLRQPVSAKPTSPSAQMASATPPVGLTPEPKGAVPPLYRRIDWISFGVTALFTFLGYLYTLAPDMTLQDSGELAVGSYYAGIPHPPGYPVWTIYTWFFTQFLPISNIAFRVGISSAVAAALACGLIALMVSRGSSMVIEGISELKTLERRWENWICMVSGFVSGALMAFNGFMWSQAVIVEVYTLSVLSLTGVMACLLRWIYAPHQYRYLYLAFFWFGICFNNHQSLLVIAMGLEVAIAAAWPRLGRDLFFWNVVIFLGGLLMMSQGGLSLLRENGPLQVIFWLVGASSAVAWVYFAIKTKKTLLELARDVVMVLSSGYLAGLFAHVTSYTMVFYYNDDFSNLKTGLFVLFNLFGLASIAGFVYLIGQTRHYGHEWRAALFCGLAWAIGAAFYLYMPIAGMTNPPMQWGYPRTVQGFFHAFTRGQYERIHPTTSFGRYLDQIVMYVEGVFEEFNLVYVLIALVPFFFYFRMQKREKAWMIGLFAIYLTLSFFLLVLLNPSPDRQSRDLNKVFFTASHVMIAMAVGYGLTLLASLLEVDYAKYRRPVLVGFGVSGLVGLYSVFATFSHTPNPIMRYTAVFGLILAAAAAVLLLLRPITSRVPRTALLTLFGLMPVYTIMSHWEENEQRGHLFGFWFGHDMFTPPFKDPKTGGLTYDSRLREEVLKSPEGKHVYPEMDRHTVLYGGTDPGRFNPTYMIFCESFIPPGKRRNPEFDRRDVYLITQNALADGTYLNYIRAHYNKSAQIQFDTPFFSELFRGPAEQAQNYFTNIVARMMVPADRFFTGLGDRIEKRRRAGSSFFSEDDFLDPAALAARLRPGASQDAVSKFVYERLSEETRALLSGNKTNALKRSLAEDLNVLIDAELASPDAEPLYDSDRFAGVKLSHHLEMFVRENPRLHTRVRLNRLLLEAAYPGLIAESPGGVYPDREIAIATPDDSQRCFTEYLTDAQRRLDHDRRFPNEPRQIKPGEDVRVVENKVQVSGQVAVMAINGLLTKVMFDKNPDHEFYVEESFPLEWMYPHLTPYGIIMKINRNPLPELTQEIIDRDHRFWSDYAIRLIGTNVVTYDTPISNICAFAERTYYRRDYSDFKGDPKFVRDNDAQKAFSKLRSSIAGVYAWRLGLAGGSPTPPEYLPKSQPEQQRLIREAEFAFKQAYAFCPYSPEALFRYVNILISIGRADDALLLARTSLLLDPHNAQIDNLITELARVRASQAGVRPPPPASSLPAEIARLEQVRQANPADLQSAYQLATLYLQSQQGAKAVALADQILKHPNADANTVALAANLFLQLNNVPKVEEALRRMVELTPENPEAWFDLAGIQAVINKPTEALQSLGRSLALSKLRRARDTNANDLHALAGTDARFNAIRALPEFQQVLEQNKPGP